nr:DUF427 domain-containing protein [Streptomyces atratus]
MRSGDTVVAWTTRPVVLYESGFALRWYVPREDIREKELTPVEDQTFRPYKGLASYYDIGESKRATWSYREACTEVGRVDDLVSFEPDKVEVHFDGERLRLEPGQRVVPRGIDRGLGPPVPPSTGSASNAKPGARSAPTSTPTWTEATSSKWPPPAGRSRWPTATCPWHCLGRHRRHPRSGDAAPAGPRAQLPRRVAGAHRAQPLAVRLRGRSPAAARPAAQRPRLHLLHRLGS